MVNAPIFNKTTVFNHVSFKYGCIVAFILSGNSGAQVNPFLQEKLICWHKVQKLVMQKIVSRGRETKSDVRTGKGVSVNIHLLSALVLIVMCSSYIGQ